MYGDDRKKKEKKNVHRYINPPDCGKKRAFDSAPSCLRSADVVCLCMGKTHTHTHAQTAYRVDEKRTYVIGPGPGVDAS